jgi:hypothetical protein
MSGERSQVRRGGRIMYLIVNFGAFQRYDHPDFPL